MLSYLSGLAMVQLVSAGIGLLLIRRFRSWVRLAYHTLGRDLAFILKMGRVFGSLTLMQRRGVTIPGLFKGQLLAHPEKPMLIFADTGETWTFRDVEVFSNRLANFFSSRGLRRGDVVAIYMTSQPLFVAIQIGLAKIGVISSLINSNLSGESLVHCINVGECSAIIFDGALQERLLGVVDKLAYNDVKEVQVSTLFRVGSAEASNELPVCDLQEELENYPCDQFPHDCDLKTQDTLVYIFTSGTTGMPKSAYCDHFRILSGAMIAADTIGISKSNVERIYCCMPLYHSAGQSSTLGMTATTGCTVIIRSKFSVGRFWRDCSEYDATVAQYIGEMCRFLLAAPRSPDESRANVRVMYGHGLNKQTWAKFTERFPQVGRIVEVYASTEGAAGAINTRGKVGAVGFIPLTIPVSPLGLIKIDEEGAPLRDPNTGMCIRCSPGEVGLLVSKILSFDRGGPKAFKPYVSNEEATKKKLLRNVWKKGDFVFSTGDLMTMDGHGWLFFQDRTGDTFRWRGENVSTTEVETVMSSILGGLTVAVYGVRLKGTEGRAGMAAIHDPESALDLAQLATNLDHQLPRYAHPIFVRLVQHIDLTGTFKLQKTKLKQEGFENIGRDELYFRAPREVEYRLLDVSSRLEVMQNPFAFGF